MWRGERLLGTVTNGTALSWAVLKRGQKENRLIWPRDLEYIKGFSSSIRATNNSHFDSQFGKRKSHGVPLSHDFSGQWTRWGEVAGVAPYASHVFLSCGLLTSEEARVSAEYAWAGLDDYSHQQLMGQCYLTGRISAWAAAESLVEAVDTLGPATPSVNAYSFLLLFLYGEP